MRRNKVKLTKYGNILVCYLKVTRRYRGVNARITEISSLIQAIVTKFLKETRTTRS